MLFDYCEPSALVASREAQMSQSEMLSSDALAEVARELRAIARYLDIAAANGQTANAERLAPILDGAVLEFRKIDKRRRREVRDGN
jgi:hypothetical protein